MHVLVAVDRVPAVHVSVAVDRVPAVHVSEMKRQ